MAHLFRLIAALLFACAAGGAGAQQVSWAYTGNTGGADPGCPIYKTWTGSSALAVESAWLNEAKSSCQPSSEFYPNYSNYACPPDNGSNATCTFTATDTYSPYTVSQRSVIITRVVTNCVAAGTTYDAVSGTCKSAKEADCVARIGPGGVFNLDMGATYSGAPTFLCNPVQKDGTSAPVGCLMKFNGAGVAGQYGNPAHWVYSDNASYTGATCDPTGTSVSSVPTTATPTAAPNGSSNPCPKGQPGEVNGLTVCIPFSATPSATQTGTTTGVATTINADGTVATTTTSTSVACSAAGACTTTTSSSTTNYNAAGTATGTTANPTSVKLQTKSEFCAANSSNANCSGPSGGGGGGSGGNGNGDGNPSGFGGTCSAFTCDGDAVMCAIAKAGNDVKCELDASKATAEAALYTAAASAPNSTGLTSSTVAISSASFDSTNSLGTGASCIGDISTTVAGHAVTIETSKVCGSLAMLGTIMLAISYLSAAFIIGRT